MKIALATTTIHVLPALQLLRKYSADVRFFVATDRKTPEPAIEFVNKIPNAQICSGAGWECHEPLGWDTLARRNIAFLEALKWGADLVISWDMDNFPTDASYFYHFEKVLAHGPFDGFGVGCASGWYDAGNLLVPQVRHRGVPYNNWAKPRYRTVTGGRVGVAASLIIGDPDIDATTRIEITPMVHNISQLGRSGVLTDVGTRTVFNTQSVAMLRELVPAWFLMPGTGRHNDIYASVVVNRVMREQNMGVHFGLPFAWQERESNDHMKDLRAEIDGMANVRKLADFLDALVLPGKSVIADTRIVYEALQHCAFLPADGVKAGLVWLADCVTAMNYGENHEAGGRVLDARPN